MSNDVDRPLVTLSNYLTDLMPGRPIQARQITQPLGSIADIQGWIQYITAASERTLRAAGCRSSHVPSRNERSGNPLVIGIPQGWWEQLCAYDKWGVKLIEAEILRVQVLLIDRAVQRALGFSLAGDCARTRAHWSTIGAGGTPP